ncbi:MAG: DUF768 domain-containing protein [Pseudomonadota bacterium]
MSKRFLKWAETWIEEKILPGANPDVESHEVRAKRLTEQLFAEGISAKYSNFEIDEERERITSLVMAAVSDSTDFDYDTYALKFLLAQENEDSD